MVYAQSQTVEDQFKVLKWSTASPGDVQALVGFGVDPMDVLQKSKGVGIYSTPYCLAKDVLATADATSNCPMVNTNEPYATEIMNALELKW